VTWQFSASDPVRWEFLDTPKSLFFHTTLPVSSVINR